VVDERGWLTSRTVRVRKVSCLDSHGSIFDRVGVNENTCEFRTSVRIPAC
jgi:hypothetical protein